MEEIKNTKVCKVCGNELPLDCFNRHGRSSDGYASVCKACAKKQGGTTNAELAKFTPRELIAELAARGYHGKLVYVQRHEIDV